MYGYYKLLTLDQLLDFQVISIVKCYNDCIFARCQQGSVRHIDSDAVCLHTTIYCLMAPVVRNLGAAWLVFWPLSRRQFRHQPGAVTFRPTPGAAGRAWDLAGFGASGLGISPAWPHGPLHRAADPGQPMGRRKGK